MHNKCITPTPLVNMVRRAGTAPGEESQIPLRQYGPSPFSRQSSNSAAVRTNRRACRRLQQSAPGRELAHQATDASAALLRPSSGQRHRGHSRRPPPPPPSTRRPVRPPTPWDGDLATYWSPTFAEPAWLAVDLGAFWDGYNEIHIQQLPGEPEQKIVWLELRMGPR